MRPRLAPLLALLAILLAAPGPASAQTGGQTGSQTGGQTGSQTDDPLRLLAFGDSLIHGYGLPAGETFPDQLEAALRAVGRKVEVVNAGNSGDTTAAGRARLAWNLSEDPDAVLLLLGANDGLRGIDPAETRRNLQAMLATLDQENLPVLLAGMLAPPNLGADYGREFNAIYPELAERHGVVFYPFFLEGVAARPALNQPDGIHPNAEGVARIVEGILPKVEQLLDRARAQAAAPGVSGTSPRASGAGGDG